jgi:hypothetical protein
MTNGCSDDPWEVSLGPAQTGAMIGQSMMARLLSAHEKTVHEDAEPASE